MTLSHAQSRSPAASPRERWPWAMLRIDSWLVPSVLALDLVGFSLAALITTAAAVLLGRNPLLPLALAVIGAMVLVIQQLWRRRSGREMPSQAVFPSLLLLFASWLVLLWCARLPLLPTLDLLSLGLAIQLTLGRLGCTLAGCCYGLPASWGFAYPSSCGQPPAGMRRLPVPLLEAGGLLLIALSAGLALAFTPAGTALALLLLLYGLMCSALEPLRGDPVRRWRGLRPAQLQAALCSSMGLLLNALVRHNPAFRLAGPAPEGGAGEFGLLLLGLVAVLWLLWRRDLWAADLRRLPEEQRQALEAFARSLRRHPPRSQARVQQLRDLELEVCWRQASGDPRTWRISARRPQPALCRAEAEWILEVIAAELSGPESLPPLVVAGPEGCYWIELPDPHRIAAEPQTGQQQRRQSSDYFEQLIPEQSAQQLSSEF